MSMKELAKRLYYVPKPSRWSRGIGAELPEAYKKFWKEWKLTEPTPVHYVKKEGKYQRNEKTGEVFPVQNIPLPLKEPRELHEGIWGGEAVVQGFVKKHVKRRRVPKFWMPELMKSVVHSEILDKYMNVVVTERTIDLIHKHCGFDHYILKTSACDLKSELALGIKREMLLALSNKTLLEDKPEQREEVYEKYKRYLDEYTQEEIEWYGLTYSEACKKHIREATAKVKIVPLKNLYRAELLKVLEEEKLSEKQENAN